MMGGGGEGRRGNRERGKVDFSSGPSTDPPAPVCRKRNAQSESLLFACVRLDNELHGKRPVPVWFVSLFYKQCVFAYR